MIHLCHTVEDCDNTSSPEFHLVPVTGTQGGGRGRKCFSCVLCNSSHVGCQAIGQLTHGYTLIHIQREGGNSIT